MVADALCRAHARIEALLFAGAPQPTGGALRPDPGSPGLGVELKRADAELAGRLALR